MNMKIIVCLKETVDTGLDLEPGLRHRVVLREGLPLLLNPDDAGALSIALGLRSLYGEAVIDITVVSIGPERVESYLRQGLALGADKAVRVSTDGPEPLSSYHKALLLSGVVGLFGADLVLTGSQSLDNGSGQVGPLLAARLGFPCIIDTVSAGPGDDTRNVIAVRDVGRGVREKLRCGFPAVLAVKGAGRLPYASLDKLVDAASSEITVLTPVDLGISPAQMAFSPLSVSGLMQPCPRPRKVHTPDSSLPAFYRILELLKGGISGRRGVMLEGSSEEIADRLFDILLEEGVLKSTEKS